MSRCGLARWLAFTSAAFAVALGGCAGSRLALDELPDAPIALVYWDGPSARERQKLIDELEAAEAGTYREGVADLGSIAGAVGLSSARPASLRLREYPGRIMLLDPRTLELRALEAAPPNARPLAWSRDRSRLLFNSSHQDGGRTQLFEFDTVSGVVRKLTRGPDYHLEGDYGPDDSLLVTWVRVLPTEQQAGLDLHTVSGGHESPIISGEYPSTPRFAPDGTRLVYVEAADSSGRARDASTIVALSPHADAERDVLARGREPVFLPDGSGVVYSAETSAGSRLRRMRADGSGRAPIGASVRNERWPAVSPDGQYVAYLSDETGIDQLYVRRLDGSGDRILLENGAVAFPVW